MEKQITIEDVYNALIHFNEGLTKKIDGVQHDINSKIIELQEKIDSKLTEAHQKYKELEHENATLKRRLKIVEKKVISINLIFYGVGESDLEDYTSILGDIVKIIINKLKITNFRNEELTNVYRIGRKKTNYHRPILVEFFSANRRKEVVAKRTLLKGSKIFINEDLTTEEREERKVLLKALRQARSSNKQCYIKNNSLVIEGNTYSYGDIIEEKHLGQNSNLPYHSPPPQQSIAIDTGVSSAEEEDVEDAVNELHSEPIENTSNKEENQIVKYTTNTELQKEGKGKRKNAGSPESNTGAKSKKFYTAKQRAVKTRLQSGFN